MQTVKQRCQSLADLSRSISLSADLIAQDCQALIEGSDGTFNQGQTADLQIIRKSTRQLLGLAQEAQETATAETTLTLTHQDFTCFLNRMLHDLRSHVSLIMGFSDLSLRGITGPLNIRHTETMKRIQQLSQIMLSALEDYQAASETLNL